jgi:hypothetical protein
MTYEPDFDLDFTRGQVGEKLVGSFLESLEGGTIEVKTDYRIAETGNVYVETWQYRLPGAVDKKQSGINTTKADYWVFASPQANGFICIATEALRSLLRDTNPREVRQPVSGVNTNASIGRLVPITSLLRAIEMYKGENHATN